MKRVIAWLCGLLSAIGITACDYINVKELQPGVSTATEVRERFGPPHMEWKNDDGSVTWEFSRQPQGVECFMITIGADNILRNIDQVLNEQTFARVEKGMNGAGSAACSASRPRASSSSSSRRRCGTGAFHMARPGPAIRCSSPCPSTPKAG